MAQEYPIADLCQVLRVPRSSYYAWRHRPASRRALQNQVLRAKLASLFSANRKVAKIQVNPTKSDQIKPLFFHSNT